MLQSKIEPYWCQDLETGEVSGSYWKSFAMGVCLELYDPDTTLKKNSHIGTSYFSQTFSFNSKHYLILT